MNNIERRSPDSRDRQRLSPRRLRKVEIELTSECIVGRRSNGTGCVHCSLKAGTGAADYLTIDQVRSILADARGLDASTVVLTGGEPAQHPSFGDVLECAKGMGLETRVYTTGVAEAWRAYPVRGVAHLIDEVYLSVEGFAETHNNVLQLPNAFQQMLEFTQELREQCVKWTAHFTPMKTNYQDLELVARKVRELGADSLKLIDFIPQGRGWTNRDSLELNEPEYCDLFSRVRRLQQELCDPGGSPFVGFHEETYPSSSHADTSLGQILNGGCTSGRESCAVLSDGTVIPCLGFRLDMAGDQPRGAHVAGNVKSQPFRQIWQKSQVMLAFANSRASEMNPECMECPMVSQCLGCCSCRRWELEQRFGAETDHGKGAGNQ